jgi:hypothetical protein
LFERKREREKVNEREREESDVKGVDGVMTALIFANIFEDFQL